MIVLLLSFLTANLINIRTRVVAHNYFQYEMDLNWCFFLLYYNKICGNDIAYDIEQYKSVSVSEQYKMPYVGMCVRT